MPTTRPSDGYQLVRGIRTASAFRGYEALHPGRPEGVLVDVFIGTDPSPAAVRAFEREVATVSALCHPHILRILELTTLGDGTPIVVSELPPGQTLKAWLDAGNRAPASVALELVVALADALAAAHARGVPHGAVVAANVFLVGAAGGMPGFPKLKGFGLEGLRETSGAFFARGGDAADGDSRHAEPGPTLGVASDLAALAVLAEGLLTLMEPPANELDRRFVLGDEVIALLERASGQVPGVPFESVTQFAVELKAAVLGDPGPLDDDFSSTTSTRARRASRGLGIALGLASFLGTVAVAFVLERPGAPLREWISIRSSIAQAASRWRSADVTEPRVAPRAGEARPSLAWVEPAVSAPSNPVPADPQVSATAETDSAPSPAGALEAPLSEETLRRAADPVEARRGVPRGERAEPEIPRPARARGRGIVWSPGLGRVVYLGSPTSTPR